MDDQVSGKKRKWDEPVRKGRIWVFARGKNIVREDFMRVFEVGADDELIIHKQMAAVRLKNSRMMRGDGYRVQRASSWDEAKKLVQRTFQNVDAGKTAAFRRAEAQRVSRQLRGAGVVPMPELERMTLRTSAMLSDVRAQRRLEIAQATHILFVLRFFGSERSVGVEKKAEKV